jgi:hypothetical protein
MSSRWLTVAAAASVLVGCGSKQYVVSQPKAEATLYAHVAKSVADPNGPQFPIVTPGTPVSLMLTWSGWCKYQKEDPPGGGNNGYPCNRVEFDAAIDCAGTTCTLKRNSHDGFEVIPTKVGVLKATVKVTAKNGDAKVLPLDPIEVVVPTSATAECFISMYDPTRANVRVSLLYQDKILQQRDASLKLKGGAACTGYGGRYECPVGSSGPASFELTTPHGTFDASASCEPEPK